MTKKKLFALCVGINEYPKGVSDLAGCVTDAENWRTFIETHYQSFSPEIVLLKNEQAQRAAVIDAFRQHLAQARDGDIVFFHYSGHGSQENAPVAYHEFFPSGKNETLVLSDSRISDENGHLLGYDLADKELGRLLEEVAENKPDLNIIVSLDCCHAGSGTRDDVQLKGHRQRPGRKDEARAIETYIPEIFTGDKVRLPSSKHVLLAACTREQKAWETTQGTGLFTSCLMKVLNQYGTAISYAELYIQTRKLMRETTNIQDPQLEVYERYNANQVIFTGELMGANTRYMRKLHQVDGQWMLDFGQIQGMPHDEMTEVALYKQVQDLKNNKVSGNAKSVQVLADKTVMEIEDVTATHDEFVALFLKPPVIPMNVRVYAEEAVYQMLNIVFEDYDSMHFHLIRVEETFGYTVEIVNPEIRYFTQVSVLNKTGEPIIPVPGDYQLVIAEGQVFVVDSHQRIVQGISNGYVNKKNIRLLFQVLDDIAQWERFARLQNNHPKLDTHKIAFNIYDEQSNELEAHELTTHFTQTLKAGVEEDEGTWTGFKFSLKVKNNSLQGLHFLLVYLDENYEIAPLVNEYIQPGPDAVTLLADQETWIDSYNNEGPKTIYHKRLDAYFVDRSTITFKLIISTERLDDFALTQAPLDIGSSLGSKGLKSRAKMPTQRRVKNDWFSKTITIHALRQRAKLATQDIDLGEQKRIKVKGNAKVSGDLRLNESKTGDRSVNPKAFLADSLSLYEGSLINLGGDESFNDLLEIKDIQGSEYLVENPLEIVLHESVTENEMLYPLVFDGTHLLPLGNAYTEGSNTYISINEIPEEDEESRSLGKSLKLAFLKIALKRHPDKLYQLAWVEYIDKKDKNGREIISRHKGLDEVGVKVKKAQKILLLVHGIIGDTEDMAMAIKDTVLDKGYDLVLSFDYENLNSSIEKDISWSLKEQLTRVGFQAEDGKELHVLAQGMGSLVVRWMIERRGGNKFVDRLILVGPPNAGSVLGNLEIYRKFATIAMGVAVGVLLPVMGWAAGLLKGINMALKQGKKLTTTLAEMHEGSTFIRDLNESDDPNIPYYIIAGDVRLYDLVEGSDFSKLKEKMFKKFGTFVNRGEANDMVVELASMKRAGKNSQVELLQVACHYWNYFYEEASLKAIQGLL